jgi:hypothetical protein
MAITAVKSNEELYNYKEHNPFWVSSPTLANINKLLFETDYPQWLMTTMTVAVAATFLSLFASVLAAYAIQRLRFKGSNYVGLGDLPGLPRPALDPVHPAGHHGLRARPVRQPAGADPHLPDLPDPVLDLAAYRLL